MTQVCEFSGDLVRGQFFDPIDDGIQIRIPRTKLARDPVATTLSNFLPIHHNIKLTRPTRPQNRIDTETLLYEGHETRDLSCIIVSGRAVNDFDPHRLSRG